MTEKLKNEIVNSFPQRDRKMIKSYPNITEITDDPICWIDSSTRYGYMLLTLNDPIDMTTKKIGLLMSPPETHQIGPHKICDLCLSTQYSKDVSFWTTRNRVNKYKVHGFYFCTDLKCLDLLRGKINRLFPPVPVQESLTQDEKVTRYLKNLQRFVDIISQE